MTLTQMMEIATKYANGEEEERLRSGKHKTGAQDTDDEIPIGSRSERLRQQC